MAEGVTEELRPADVESYTAGRLSAGDPEVQRALDAALARARRYCDWHVSPIREETFTVDGDGSDWITLPSRNVISVSEVAINGVVIDPSEYRLTSRYVLERPRLWPRGRANIAVTVTHGYAAADAPDFREAVLRMVDQAAAIAENEGLGPLRSREVDDVKLSWAGGVGLDADVQAMVDPFRRKWFAA